MKRLAHDRYFTSSDYNECVKSNGGCDHICINNILGHHCDCYDGFTLDRDNITCVANAECSGGVCTCLEGFVDEGTSGSGDTVKCVGTYITLAFLQSVFILKLLYSRRYNSI